MSRHPVLSRVPILFLILGLSAGPAALFAQCGDNEPATPVPECRAAAGGDEVSCTQPGAARLWPDGFQPGRPGQQLPAVRDSTQWRSFTIPGFSSGHELFHSLDIVGDRLVVVYNAGLQVWNLGGGNAENPQRLEIADGWLGNFFQFPSAGENDFFVYDVAAIDPSGGNQDLLIAVAGEDGVGTSIWRYTRSPSDLDELYQDLGTGVRQVRVVEFGGRVYAFAAARPTDGVYVYDMTAAANLSSGCLDDRGTVCPGVFLGRLGDTTWASFLDVEVANDKVYVAVGRNAGRDTEIWELADPSDPGSAVRRFEGLTSVQGIALFEWGGEHYLAVVERVVPPSGWDVRIYRASNCLTGSGSCTVQSIPWSYRPAQVGVDRFLTFSTSNGTPYLYYGVQSNALEGAAIEGLFDLTHLGGSNNLPEITESGDDYTDECTGNTVDYWGDYYENNGHGLRNVRPRVGKFRGDFFYRAAFGILDVHKLTGPGVPMITTTVDDPPPHFMSFPIDFSAIAENCAGAENWDWFDDDTVASTIDDNGDSAIITFGLCNGSDCPEREVEVWALKNACADDPSLIEDRAMVTVMEPRPHIRAIDVCPATDPGCPQLPAPEFPVCSVLRFTADVDGRPAFSYLWQVRDAAGTVLLTSTQQVFDWDTRDVELGGGEDIFADGFESGDLSGWDSFFPLSGLAPPAPKAPLPSLRQLAADLFAKGSGDSASFDVDLTVSNSSGNDMDTQALTLVALGELGFGTPAITATDQGGGTFTFQANSDNATEWRWEFEDPENGTTVGCLFYDSCQIYDWGQSGAATFFQWQAPNVPGMYGAAVSIRNCVQETPLSASIVVEVTEIINPDPVELVDFTINDPDCSLVLGFYECPPGVPITFEVTATGDPDTYEFDWDGDGDWDQQLPATITILHTYTTTGTFTPRVRAIRGPEVTDPLDLDNPIIIE